MSATSSNDKPQWIPEKPLWRANDPLPTEDELLNQDRTVESFNEVPGVWDVPRGPTEARVKAVWEPPSDPYDEAAVEKAFARYRNSLLHPQGEVMASWKNYLYLNAPAWMGGRPWSQPSKVRRFAQNIERYPQARHWFSDGFRYHLGLRAIDHVAMPDSVPETMKKLETKRVWLVVATCVVAGSLLSAFSHLALGTKKAPTENAEWDKQTEQRYKKYHPDPISGGSK
eukprot:CAMPEP_0201554190 /NCGR_PEP_ID=MMETSP0173_2-20130828/38699_1 /ASSEMBLY_ACC=CAM_ASM_000268 /TAXON_ID=218659 /ORGANISM="Vexillifera sp., Strain DIVA3 564/2" /LENGTH=226 /DNA_ID=CAMNT_0047965379 /DNA_START=48 /DNA_END=728 /DNA_ORIENTATION=+